MDIILKPEQEKLILAKVNSGRYTTVDEVIAEALQLLDKRDKHYQIASSKFLIPPDFPSWEGLGVG
ncbi:MAG: hypothetical protein F6K24_32085 [Okeania sp. SIO2D1]|nr:hypothetical protein [Okeania sp. SIO2D1]